VPVHRLDDDLVLAELLEAAQLEGVAGPVPVVPVNLVELIRHVLAVHRRTLLEKKKGKIILKEILTNAMKTGEIFDRSDFPDFYTIKSLCEGDFGVLKKLL